LNPPRTISSRILITRRRLRGFAGFCLLLLLGLTLMPRLGLAAPAPAGIELDATPRFNVTRFQVQGKYLLPTNALAALFSRYTGTNVSLDEIIRAASALDLEYLHEGYPNMNVIVAPGQIQDGVVTLAAFPGAVPQVVIAGYRYLVSSNGFEAPPQQPPPRPLFARRAPLSARATGTSTNAGPRFAVNNYQITGNTLLSPKAISLILTNIPGAFGTNVSLDKIVEVRSQILAAYRERGYVAVAVELPPQKLTNATVKLDVIEGRLAAIYVKGNRYFSSNNVMRAMPGLHTNMMLNAITFQAELNRANANQDRQIYPVIDPGPDPGTSDLTLDVKDRLPLHEKVELNNESSPGTPDLRVDSSVVYDNLWQQEQVLGLQYGFSPEQYKEGGRWNFYDLPSVANYSAFYRIPIGSPGAIDDAVAAAPGTFGYNEATRKFNLPPASGQPDLTLFASRSTIDDGLTSSTKNLYTDAPTNNGVITTNSTLNLLNNHQDITINNDVGFRLNFPVATPSSFHMGFSGGLDFKTYSSASVGTNIYLLNSAIINSITTPPTTNYNHSSDTTPIPATYNEVYYVPLALRYDSSWQDFLGNATLGLGMSADLWDSALSQQTVYGSITNITATSTNLRGASSITSAHGLQALQGITGSKDSTGHWVVLNPTFSHTFQFVTNWVTTFRADGQWASEPLIANEQFGAGGVNSVRGYHEGEVFGDTGWHLSLEQQTPPHTVGMINGRIPLVIRGTVYMDYARVYLLDPMGRQDETALWGTGFGCVASIGSYWQARLLLSFPLLNAGTITAYHPFFDFALTAQF
jgi:hemolysin activation/secretion protein